MDQTRVECSLSQEDITQRNEEMDYQASDNREGENSQAAYQVQNGFNDMSHIEESPKAKREISTFSDGRKLNDETKKPGHMDQYRVKYGLQLDDVEEEDQTCQTNNSPVKSKGNGEVNVSVQQTDPPEFPRHQPYQKQSSAEHAKGKSIEKLNKTYLSFIVEQEGSSENDNSRKETLNHLEMARQASFTRNQIDVPDVHLLLFHKPIRFLDKNIFK